MLRVYREFLEETLAIPVLIGCKTPAERFAGAYETYAVEALMRDGKALQAGTSHNLGQNFSKAFNIQFQDKNGQLSYVWQTSWGVSTRLIGALIMAHGDNQGLILPPKISPVQVVIVPIYKKEEEKGKVIEAAHALKSRLKGYSVVVDDRDQFKPGMKFYEWEKKGVPLRVEMGPNEFAENKVLLADRLSGKKWSLPVDEFASTIGKLLDDIQDRIKARALEFRTQHTFQVDQYEEFKKKIEESGGFFEIHWCGSPVCEEKIKEETKATVRCILLDAKEEKGNCIYCQSPSPKRVVVARAY
jgi:prolyl-tRNA synthetase